jgi:hypothetical protein
MERRWPESAPEARLLLAEGLLVGGFLLRDSFSLLLRLLLLARGFLLAFGQDGLRMLFQT